MAHPDLNRLMSAILPLAKRMLADSGEFFPYGAFMKSDQIIVDCGATGEGENPSSQSLIDILAQEFQERASKGEIRAAGICCDVRVAKPGQLEKQDAIQISLEHQNGEAVDIFLPYDMDSSGEIRYGELIATPRDRRFFEYD